MRGVRPVLGLVWVVGGGLTALHVAAPARFALDSSASSTVVETVAGCAATLLAVLSYGRWTGRRQAPDLITCYAFSLLAVGSVAFAVLPIAAGAGPGRIDVRGAALLSGLIAVVLFLTASLVPERTVRVGRPRFDLVLFIVGVLLVAGEVALVAAHTTSAFHRLAGLPSAEVTGADSGDAVAAAQLAAAAAFVVSSFRFARRGRRNDDPFYAWLAVTLALWAVARVNWAFTPQWLSSRLTVGDWFRLAAYGVAVMAAATEFTRYWRHVAQIAVLEERRRIARDLHDGLAQELSFIATQARGLAKRSDGTEELSVIAHAAERSLDESRRAIAALTRRVDEPLDVALAQQAEELAGRLGVVVRLDLERGISVTADTREALLRIAREAITNAGRHANPSTIEVGLENHDGVTLRVSDDGEGFAVDDPRVSAPGRYGLSGMQERAAALGGRFEVQSRRHAGTRVEVWVP